MNLQGERVVVGAETIVNYWIVGERIAFTFNAVQLPPGVGERLSHPWMPIGGHDGEYWWASGSGFHVFASADDADGPCQYSPTGWCRLWGGGFRPTDDPVVELVHQWAEAGFDDNVLASLMHDILIPADTPDQGSTTAPDL